MFHSCFVYVDFTLDTGEPFYVGKGTLERTQGFQRNAKHSSVKSKHGINRKVVWEGNLDKCAQVVEVRLIAELHTFVGDPFASSIACNFTRGGDGISPAHNRGKPSPSKGKRIPKLSLAKIGKPGHPWTEARRQRQKGVPAWNKGKADSEGTRDKKRNAKRKPQSEQHVKSKADAKRLFHARKRFQKISLEWFTRAPA